MRMANMVREWFGTANYEYGMDQIKAMMEKYHCDAKTALSMYKKGKR